VEKAAGAGWPKSEKRRRRGCTWCNAHSRSRPARELGCITAIPTTLRATKRSSSGDRKMRKSAAASRVLCENDRKKGFSAEKDAAPKRVLCARIQHEGSQQQRGGCRAHTKGER
jgi:hypothetical protein